MESVDGITARYIYNNKLKFKIALMKYPNEPAERAHSVLFMKVMPNKFLYLIKFMSNICRVDIL